MAAIEEFSVGYPVKFWTGGDTTRDAFGRLIQEIERIYGILNALATGKAAYDEIASAVGLHKYEANPHPNWKPSMSFSDLAGNIPVSKITGLDSVVGNGIADYNVSNGQTENENGYAKFKNGLTFQWGRVSPKSAAVNFLKAFSSQCFNVTISLEVPGTITLTETISAGGSSSTTPATNGVIVGQIVPDTITETYEAGTTIKAPVFFCGLTPETIRTTGFKFWINCADADKLRATIFFNYMKLHYFAVGV